MASKKSAKKRKIRNRKPNPNAYHRHRRGGKTFAERRGKEIQIAEIQDQIAVVERKLGKIWNSKAYHGNKEFTPFWHSGRIETTAPEVI